MANITREQAARLVAAIEDIQGCDDADYRLDEALSSAREAIKPWYDYRPSGYGDLRPSA